MVELASVPELVGCVHVRAAVVVVRAPSVREVGVLAGPLAIE